MPVSFFTLTLQTPKMEHNTVQMYQK